MEGGLSSIGDSVVLSGRPLLNDYRDDVPIWRVTPGPLIYSLVLFLFATAALSPLASRRLTVTVNNLGDVPLRLVTVHVTGAQYRLEDIGPGESVTTLIKPHGESDIEIEVERTDSRPQRLLVGCYVESGATGDVSVDLEGNQIIDVRDEVTLY